MKKVSNELLEYWIEDGILYSRFNKPMVMSLELMKESIQMRHEISDYKKQYWCLIAEKVKSYPKEARDYSAVHGQDYLHACATVVNSHIATFIFNAYNRINKPSIPFRAFKTKDAAVEWLRTLKQENEARGIL
jgi:hypothetical protein